MSKVNKQQKINIHEEYWLHFEKYQKKYGKKSIVLMQVGSFHEVYCTDKDGINLNELSQELNITCTQKNKSNPLSKTNPKMMGFPSHTTYNYIDKLIDLNYTVVLIDQTTEPPNPKREVTNIFSPATYFNKLIYQYNFI